ncbi:uncharacterized protein LOC125038637 [Penaeus chinensis]|uniref:uncharacterized protein LOC125038637 n=1 Tax=Penaeus chinensis TaxID=139456 RepID=UPI001FB63660|nr:uncharacterized protein LOC125038637 [Penaeus chinensis]
MTEVSQPMERVSVDLIDFMGSTRGNRYVLSITDHFTRYLQVCQIIQTRTHYTTRYHPEANRMVERSNKVVKDALATLVGEYPDSWDEMLPFVRLALNSTVHRSDTDEETAQILRGNLRDARLTAKEAARKAQRGWARDYNRRVRQRFDPAEGDLVLLRNFARPGGSARALGPRWNKPVRIVKKIGPVN